jgi:hypothetical protein
MKHDYQRVKVFTLSVLAIVCQIVVWAQGCTPPTMTSPNTLTICSGQGVNLPLTANQPNVIFTWVATSNANILGESTTTQNSSTITDVLSCVGPTSTVTYTVTPNSPNCPGVPQTVTVNVVTAPLITSPGQLAICSGSSVGLTITTNSPGSTISWVATNNPNVSGESTSVQNGSIITDFLVNNTNLTQTVTYTITATSLSGCTVNNILVVAVHPTPVLTSASNTCVCSGNSIGLFLSSSIAGTSFTWVATDNPNVSGESLTLQNSSSITDVLVNQSSTNQIVVYSVTPTAYGCVGPTQTVSICVNPILTMTSPNSVNVTSGSSVNLLLTATIPNTSFNWYANSNPNVTGESLSAQNGSTITDVLTNTTQVNQTVTYFVIPTSTTNGCSGAIQTVTVTVTSGGTAPSMTSLSSVSICSGFAVNLPFTANLPNTTYSWVAITDNPNVTGESTTSQNSGILSDNLSNSTTIDQTVTYSVTPTSNGNTGATQTVIVTVKPTPIITNINTLTICSNDNLNFTLNSNISGTTFTWVAANNTNVSGESTSAQSTSTINDVLVNTTTASQNIVYTVTPTFNGCTGTPQTVTVTVQPNYSGTLDTTSTGSVVINGVTYDSTGTFTQVLTSSNGCDSLLTIQFTLGLDDLEPSVFEVYPNPSNGVFYIVHQLAAGTPYAFIDPMGRVLFEGKLESGKTLVDTGNIASGTYYVRVLNRIIQIGINK